MEQSKQKVQLYQEDEIDLRALVYSLIERKFLILGLTAFITVLVALYTTTFTTTYQAISSFTLPPPSSVANINKLIYTSETKKSIFANFLSILPSQELQKNVFVENDFLTQFNPDNNPIDNVDAFIEGVISSVKVVQPKLKAEEIGFYLTEEPYSIIMNGSNLKAISNYLDALVEVANSKTITKILELNQQKISIRLDQIAIESEMLLKKFKQSRLNQINRIMEEDGQKLREINDQIEALKISAKQVRLNQINRIIEKDGQKLREINDQIDRVRYKAKENRLSQIVVLSNSAKVAKSLGIIENNFKVIDGNSSNSDLTIAIGETKDLPEWYFYGEKALLQRIELLESRTSDDPFIPELVILNNQINEIQNNNLLKTLKARQDDSPFTPELVTLNNQINKIQNNNLLKTLKARQNDSPFIPELVTLNLEKDRLESTNINISNTKSVGVLNLAKETSSNRNKNVTLIVILAFFVSLLMSILLALIMNALKPDEKAPA